MTSHASHRNGGMLITRNELSMPKWVAEQSDRIGPRPPPPPLTPENGLAPPKQPSLPPKTKQLEPDYEVIEFSNQQYSNAPLRPNSASSGSKTPDNKLKCTLCGSGNPWVTCEECAQQIFCASCDDMFHKHPKRKSHQRKAIEQTRPPLPPKVVPGQSGPTPPVAPPRRSKRGFITPIMQRKAQGNAMPGPFPEPISPTPSMKNASWQERLGSLPRGLNLLNRPLPDTPKTASESSRSTTPKSVFDNIQRPPSVALEKIKSKANATLDRMQLLQQRYRQQKEQMERERCGSVTDQNMSAFDQWSSISQSPSHFRSGSMSSGINSSQLDLMDDTNFNLFHQRQLALQHRQSANQLGQRGMSSSVFNLNHINRKQPVANNEWMNNPMQQAQSMAQLNCGNCAQQQLQWNGINQHQVQNGKDAWGNQLSSQQHLNRSNMSLNMPAGYMMQPQMQMNNIYPPPTFMNQRNLMPQMYPHPYMGGMPVMNPGLMCMPPSTSRAASRAGSRMASPAMSRQSVTLRRKQRSCYIDDEATDDEDSDEDDRRSITSTRSGVSRSRQRRMSSASQFQLDDDIKSTQGKMHRNRARNHRRDSVSNSVHNDWSPGRRTSSINNNRSADSGFNSPLKPSRIYSDLDSEGSGTRALVQAKIEQKLKEESLKQKQSKPKGQSKSVPTQKTSAAVQTPAAKQTLKHGKTEKAVEEPVKQVQKPLESELETDYQSNKKKEVEEAVEVIQSRASAAEEEEEAESEREQTEASDSSQENEEMAQRAGNATEDDLGPPPSTPDHEWECEFCTYVNEANIKICSICCKTPSVKPRKAFKSASPNKQIEASLNKPVKEHKKMEEQKSVKNKNATIKKAPSTHSQSLSAQHILTNNTNNLQTSKADSIHSKSDRNQPNQESIEDIWASLDENIQTTANEVTRKANSKEASQVSSTYSSSSKPAGDGNTQENDSRQSQARERITSPTPQNISTQTYDTLPTPKTEGKNESVQKPAPQTLHNNLVQTHFPLTPKIYDLKAFEAEVLKKIHNISHVPAPYHNHHANHNIYSYNDRQRYCSNNDLRMDDAMPVDFEAFNGLEKRQPSISELMLLPKTSSQIHSPFGGSTYDLPHRELPFVRPNAMENHKEADLYKHTTEELNAALKYCGPDMHPLIWLRDNWPKLIQTVQGLATKYGQERAENTIGTISQMEAREALRMHTGNIWQAVSECIEQRQKKYREISLKGNFSREDIVTALTTHQGNVELALLDLGRTQLKPFLMRIWGSPGGVENESSSTKPLPAETHSSTQFNLNKDIHSFLRANASECMQTPNDTGAYLNNNQMPSPFDRTASSNSPFESNNHMPDNTSSYRTESRNDPNNPLQLDEFVLGNKNVLEDLETLIGNMEHSQQKQSDHLLRSVYDMISNKNQKSENESDSDSIRILTKSPIISPKLKTTSKESNFENEADVKNFVWQHIQEIVPNFVQQVERELKEAMEDTLNTKEPVTEAIETTIKLEQSMAAPPPPPIDQDEFLMEEVIRPNIKVASIREALPTPYFYTAEIVPFQLAFDKGLGKEHEEEFEFVTLEEASRQVYKMFTVPEDREQQQESKVTEQISDTATVEVDLKEIANETPSDDNKRSGSPQISRYAATFDKIELEEAEIRMAAITVEAENAEEKVRFNQTDTEIPKTSNESPNIVKEVFLDENYIPTAISAEINSDAINKSDEISSQKLVDFDLLSESNEANNNPPRQPNIKDFAEGDINIILGQEVPRATFSESSASLVLPTISAHDTSQTLDSSFELENDENTVGSQIHFSGNPLRLFEEPNDNEDENVAKTNTILLDPLNLNEKGCTSESKDFVTQTPKSAVNKKMSKIPVRRTASLKSLINCPTILTRTDSTGHIKPLELNSASTATETEIPQTISKLNPQTQEKALHSSGGNTEVALRADQLQSPNAISEMFLVIQEEGSESKNTIAPSASNSTLYSTTSQSSSFKSPEFIPSGDPSKQNLTELVEDTQRLIKQMKDEISIDDFESSTDDDDYSDEFSDEYDDGDEEEEEEEDWEEEEDEDDEEYDDITEDITEENEVFSFEEDAFSKTQTPLPSQESQDHANMHYSPDLSNTTESSNHSLTFSYDDFVQEDPIITNINIPETDETAAFVETENNLPEQPVETVIADNLKNSQSAMQYVETINPLPEMPVEIVLSQDDQMLNIQTHSNTLIDSNEKTEIVSSIRDILLASNGISELPVETVLVEIPIEIESNRNSLLNEGSKTFKPLRDSNEQVPVAENGLPQADAILNDLDKDVSVSENSANTLDVLPSISIQDKTTSIATLSLKETPINKQAGASAETDAATTQTSSTEIQYNAPQSTSIANEISTPFFPNSAKTPGVLPSISIQEKTTSTLKETPINQQAEASAEAVAATTQTDFTEMRDDLPQSTSIANAISSPLPPGEAAPANNDSLPSTSKPNKASPIKTKTKEDIKKSSATSKIPKPREINKEPKPKEVMGSKPKNALKKNLYTRSKSFSGPATPIGIASVKTISQKFTSPSSNAQLATPKKHFTSTKRSSIVEAINKFTKPSTNSEKAAVNSIFKPRAQPRIPKKNYHETCFSDDDYESSSEEQEIETLEVRQRKLSVPVFKAYPSLQEPEEFNTEELVDKFMKEELCTSVAEAQIAAALVSMKFQQDVSLWAAKECSDLEHAIALLKQECELCSGTYALNQIVSMLKCTHKCCKQCAKTYFTVQITERSINDCSCPFCKLPELHHQLEHEDENLEYFSNLDIFLKNILEPEVHELFQCKLRDRTLLKDPNFKWCVQCSSGFFARPKQKRLICPDCGSVTCAQCRKTWQKQHEGISCDQFSEWESANDPEVQAKGVQQHLERNGIDCPKCKFKYALARGGCMHFTCTQCKYEFCYGCAKPFMMGAKCSISPYCAKLGLHAHHPRNCLFYLRDKLPVQLQILLKNNNVSFEVEPIEVASSGNDNEPSSSQQKKELLCSIPIQKETPTGLVDTRCNGDVPEKHAGMCRNHYVEYLTAKVAKAKIDPLPIFDLTDCVQELRRRGIALPERGPWDTDEIYKNMCAEVIRKNIPLQMD